MRFSEYLARNDLSDGAMAEQLGCDRTYVLKMRGGKVPSPEMIKLIAEKTGGAVQFDDWFRAAAA